MQRLSLENASACINRTNPYRLKHFLDNTGISSTNTRCCTAGNWFVIIIVLHSNKVLNFKPETFCSL